MTAGLLLLWALCLSGVRGRSPPRLERSDELDMIHPKGNISKYETKGYFGKAPKVVNRKAQQEQTLFLEDIFVSGRKAFQQFIRDPKADLMSEVMPTNFFHLIAS